MSTMFYAVVIAVLIEGLIEGLHADKTRLGILGENECGPFVKQELASTFLTSPNYPEPYPNRLNCIKDIVVPENTIIRLYFYDFDLEWSRNCWLDRLEIWQRVGEEVPYQRLGTYCGTRKPPLFVSSQPIRLVLHSDRHHTRRGFQAYVEFVRIP